MMQLHVRSHLTRTSAGLAIALAAGSLAVLGSPTTALADTGTLPSGCVMADATTVTCTWTSTGAEQSFTVPSGVTSLQVGAVGAAGAPGGDGTTGGRGASVAGQLPVVPGQVLYLEVAGMPTDAGCYPGVACVGGFNGGGSSHFGGGGGGATDVRTTSTSVSADLSSRLVVAAGGGGGGENVCFDLLSIPGDGGDAGADGSTARCGASAPTGGGAGTATGGGAGGIGDYSPAAGALGVGASPTYPAGGGGGAGLYGGGAGNFDSSVGLIGAGGGGGSSLVPVGWAAPALSSAAPSVTISYPVLAVTPIAQDGTFASPYTSQTVASGGTAPYTFAVTSGSLPPGLTLASDGTLSGTPSAVGTEGFTITATDAVGLTGSASSTVTIGQASTGVSIGAMAPVVYGQSVTATAPVTGGDAGYVKFTVDGVDVGAPVPVSAGGSATSQALGTMDVGPHAIGAVFSPESADYAGSTGGTTLVVDQASTTTSVSVTAAALHAAVVPVGPGSGQPSGTVTFSVGGQVVGTAPVDQFGAAVLPRVVSGAVVVSAAYAGDSNFAASSGSDSTSNPSIAARLSSASPKSATGWYRAPVTVTFTCRVGSARLTAACPAPAVLSRTGAAQTVTRTIHAADGGIATVALTGINIDRVRPRVAVNVRNGAAYDAPRAVRCVAHAGVSGLAGPCRVSVTRSGLSYTYRAIARSGAGLVTVIRGRYTVRAVTVVGAPLRNGVYRIRKGRTYALRAYAPGRKAPTYWYAAPLGARPGPGHVPMVGVGHGSWQLPIAFGRTPYRIWTCIVQVGTRRKVVRFSLR